jgi:hypothetical protein
VSKIFSLVLAATMTAMLAAATDNLGPQKPVTGEIALLSEKQDEWQKTGCVTGLTLAQARELLDWLENQGCTGLEVSCQDGIGFTVRFPGRAADQS